MRVLLAHGADPTLCDHDGWTALHAASVEGNAEVARVLLEAWPPADVNARDVLGASHRPTRLSARCALRARLLVCYVHFFTWRACVCRAHGTAPCLPGGIRRRGVRAAHPRRGRAWISRHAANSLSILVPAPTRFLSEALSRALSVAQLPFALPSPFQCRRRESRGGHKDGLISGRRVGWFF